MKSKVIKGITITMFSVLIISFVAYRSGYLGELQSTQPVSPNGSALSNQRDNIPKKDSLKKIEMMSSSKVLILRDQLIHNSDSNTTLIDSIITDSLNKQ